MQDERGKGKEGRTVQAFKMSPYSLFLKDSTQALQSAPK